MKLLSSEEFSIFRIALNREQNIAKMLDEKAGGYYTRICNAIEWKVEEAIPKAAIRHIIGQLKSKNAEPGSRMIAIDDVIEMLEEL